MDQLTRRLEDPEFRRLHDQLLLLRDRFRPLPIAMVPLTAKELAAGETPRVVIGKTSEPFEVTKKKARLFLLEAHGLAQRLAGHFPQSQRWRWQYLLMECAVWGRADVLEERGGGPIPMPMEEKRRIVQGWRKVKGRQNKEVFASVHGVSARHLSRLEKEVDEQTS